MKRSLHALPSAALAAAALVLGGVGGTPAHAQDDLVIGSFTGARSRAPFATAGGTLGYSQLRSSLLDPANFGPDGIVSCPAVIAPGTETLTAAYLADKDVFFSSVFTGLLTGAEQTAIADFVAGGGVVITDANSSGSEQAAATSLLQAFDPGAAITGPTGCSQNANAGDVSGDDNELTNGPFGDIRGGTFSTSLAALPVLGGATSVVTCNAGARDLRAFFPTGALGAGSGLVHYGGDPHAFNLFTTPGSFFNPNNEIIYLNAIAAACAPAVGAVGGYGVGTVALGPGLAGRVATSRTADFDHSTAAFVLLAILGLAAAVVGRRVVAART